MTALPEAFLRETPARQLGALAASLARVASSARKPARAGAIGPMIHECIQFIEHAAPKLAPEVAAELANMQVLLGLWETSWPLACQHGSQRALLYMQAREWANRVLHSSGLLDQS